MRRPLAQRLNITKCTPDERCGVHSGFTMDRSRGATAPHAHLDAAAIDRKHRTMSRIDSSLCPSLTETERMTPGLLPTCAYAVAAFDGGGQNVSRPMDRCHETSQCAPTVTDVTASAEHHRYHGIPAVRSALIGAVGVNVAISPAPPAQNRAILPKSACQF